ncbi:hypothetical protein Vadar_018014 [Vaccinium darrowii]|uniref:Uncharacterized protein n=1 Tax=Vaccinium darrowii TaxID=229202 RepID=A0ACB7YWR2_9ERIC|nr:hypothetical protein Vadar_018014 [Vaccinium darrowii]
MAAKMVGEALLGSAKFVGEALVDSAVEMLLGRLASQDFIDFFRGRKHDEGLLKKLELTLLELKKLDAGEFSKLQKLEVIKCTKLITDLPKKVPALVNLEIRECPELVASLPRTNSIRKVLLRGCQEVQLEWQGVSFVEELKMSGFRSLKEFESELITLTNLKMLEVSECSILSLPQIGFPLKLTSLSVEDCGAMQCFPGGMMCLVNLKDLWVERCSELVLPLQEEISHCNMSLEILTLYDCESLKSLPLGLFPKLRCLKILECINFETLLIPDGLENHNLTLLEYLTIIGCNKMKLSLFQKLVGDRRNWGLQRLPSLRELYLFDEVVDSFPEEGLLPSTLTTLCFGNMLNLTSLNRRGLLLLVSLKKMEIWDCPKLQSLPEEGLPTSLFALMIWNCPLLTPRCRREGGEDWHKVAHVPLIVMDGEAIFDQVDLGPMSLFYTAYAIDIGQQFNVHARNAYAICPDVAS